jgi:tRNA-specific 2-thiouridylase
MLKRKKRVLVGMSGGVDSSVAACLLLEKGYDVTGVHMKYWADEGKGGKSGSNKCCTVESAVKAVFVCRKLKIPLVFVDMKKEFRDSVVDRFISGTAKGLTPNPCVECNRTIKFGAFLEKMKELGADFIATGHYARIRKTGRGRTVRYDLLKGVDEDKDQSYFLYTLNREKLKHVIFPLGGMLKSEVRKLAVRFGIEELNEQKESQNLCFLPDESRESFLRKHLGLKNLKPGPIVDSAGKVLGGHAGLALYTIGQRKGINIGGGPALYVTRKDAKRNALIVGGENDLLSRSAALEKVTYVSGEPLPDGARISVKIRYRNRASAATLKRTSKDGSKVQIVFSAPRRAVTPGQSVVFYRGDRVLGGGIII